MSDSPERIWIEEDIIKQYCCDQDFTDEYIITHEYIRKDIADNAIDRQVIEHEDMKCGYPEYYHKRKLQEIVQLIRDGVDMMFGRRIIDNDDANHKCEKLLEMCKEVLRRVDE